MSLGMISSLNPFLYCFSLFFSSVMWTASATLHQNDALPKHMGLSNNGLNPSEIRSQNKPFLLLVILSLVLVSAKAVNTYIQPPYVDFTYICINSFKHFVSVCHPPIPVHTGRAQRSTMGAFPYCSSTPFVETGFTGPHTHWFNWMVSKPQRSYCLCLPGLGLQAHAILPAFLCGCWGSYLTM